MYFCYIGEHCDFFYFIVDNFLIFSEYKLTKIQICVHGKGLLRTNFLLLNTWRLNHTPSTVVSLTAGGQEGVVLFCEDSSILDLKLDQSDGENGVSLWAATTNTHVNKWPTDPSTLTNGKMEEEERNMAEEDEEEEEVGITDIDDPQPIFSQPLALIPGNPHCVFTRLTIRFLAVWLIYIQVGGASGIFVSLATGSRC